MIRGTTTLVGLFRDPLAQSLSPPMQNAVFEAVGLDWAYVPLGVHPPDLEDAVRGLVALGYAGANVTIPHKLGVVAFCDTLDPVAERKFVERRFAALAAAVRAHEARVRRQVTGTRPCDLVLYRRMRQILAEEGGLS